jgi:BirA family biotin operon repressor/biotin-[acetyl-CoA-carboxylase] ligase
MTQTPFYSRREWFAQVGSTNDVVRGWLGNGVPEVCLAVADQQSAGRGREGRRWVAPARTALLVSAGFRPTYLAPDRAWRLAASVSLAMVDAAEEVAGLAEGTVRLKWPNDLVVDASGTARKLGGVLGESDGLGTARPRVVVGIGVNADWAAADFPAELAADMTSLREASGGRPIDREALLDAFADRLEPRVRALRDGRFDAAGWTGRQLTSGRLVLLDLPDGRSEVVRAAGVDPLSGALLVVAPDRPGVERAVLTGEIRHLRLAGV